MFSSARCSDSCACPDEIERALGYESPDSSFDEPELFVWHMSRVPRLEARLKCLKIINGWDDKKAKVEESINTSMIQDKPVASRKLGYDAHYCFSCDSS